MKTNDFRLFIVFEVTSHGVSNHVFKFIQGVGLSINRGGERFRFEATLDSFLDKKDDFVHKPEFSLESCDCLAVES